jgi:hypothetical protein
MIDKRTKLQSSTLGNLILILSKHGIAPGDLHYLNWVKEKRDFFVHRFFQQGCWPGELVDNEIDATCRKLLYLKVIFARAGDRIWRIFERSDLMSCQNLGKDGVLMMNLDLFENEDDSGGG